MASSHVTNKAEHMAAPHRKSCSVAIGDELKSAMVCCWPWLC